MFFVKMSSLGPSAKTKSAEQLFYNRAEIV